MALILICSSTSCTLIISTPFSIESVLTNIVAGSLSEGKSLYISVSTDADNVKKPILEYAASVDNTLK